MLPRRIARVHGLAPFGALLLFDTKDSSAQADPAQLIPMPEGTWNAILGAADMDQDPAEEIVLISEDDRLLIVASSTRAIEFDSNDYGGASIYAPG